MRVAHISDLHFGRVNEAVIKALLADIRAVAPDLIIASGDFTQAGRHREFRRARAFLDRLPAPVFAVPGNHDMPHVNLAERLVSPFRRYRMHLSGSTEPDMVLGPLQVVGLNSARPFGWHWNWAHGRLSRRQIARLADRFGPPRPGGLKIAVAHHPFLPPPRQPGAKLIGQAGAALSAMSKQGVDLILGGHFHVGYSDTVTVAFQGNSRSMVVAQVSTTTSSRLRGQPNAYNLIEVAQPFEDRFRIAERPFNGTAFIAGQETEFARDAAGWRRSPAANTQPGGDRLDPSQP